MNFSCTRARLRREAQSTPSWRGLHYDSPTGHYTVANAILIIVVMSYLLGSIPFGYLLVRIFRGEDVRQSGSGNIGATNVPANRPCWEAHALVWTH